MGDRRSQISDDRSVDGRVRSRYTGGGKSPVFINNDSFNNYVDVWFDVYDS